MKWHNLNPILRWGTNRIKRNQNCIIIINGSTGSGKTYSGIDMANEFAKIYGVKFTIKNNLDFTFKGLIKKMDLPENSGVGTPYLFEEVGVIGGGAASSEWQTKANAFFNSFIQTARHLNQILIFTCPNFHNLDKKSRELVHCQFITNGINYRNKICLLNPYFLQVNPTTAKIYRKRLRFKVNGIKYKLTQVQTNYPPNNLVIEYEKFKTRFTDELKRKILSDTKDKPKGSKIDKDIIDKQFEGGLDNEKIAEIWQVSIRTIERHRKRHKTYNK